MVVAYTHASLSNLQRLASVGQHGRYDAYYDPSAEVLSSEDSLALRITILVHFVWHLLFFVYMALVWTVFMAIAFMRHLNGYRSEDSYLS